MSSSASTSACINLPTMQSQQTDSDQEATSLARSTGDGGEDLMLMDGLPGPQAETEQSFATQAPTAGDLWEALPEEVRLAYTRMGIPLSRSLSHRKVRQGIAWQEVDNICVEFDWAR